MSPLTVLLRPYIFYFAFRSQLPPGSPFFHILNVLGLFRVDTVEEEVGLDISHHKGAAYDLSGPTDDAKEKYEISTSQRKLVVPNDDDA